MARVFAGVRRVSSMSRQRLEADSQEGLRMLLGISDPATFIWPRSVPYFYCGYYRWIQHSGYLRQLEEVVDRFLSHAGFPIGPVFRERRWVPIVQEHSLDIFHQVEMDEILYTTFRVTDVVASRLFRARADFYVIRGARPLLVAAGQISHGYAKVATPEWESRLVRFDPEFSDLLRRWMATGAEPDETAAP